VSLTGVFGDIPESYSALSIFSGSKSSIKGDLPSFLTVSTDVDTSNVDTSTRFLCYEVSNILTSKAWDPKVFPRARCIWTAGFCDR